MIKSKSTALPTSPTALGIKLGKLRSVEDRGGGGMLFVCLMAEILGASHCIPFVVRSGCNLVR